MRARWRRRRECAVERRHTILQLREPRRRYRAATDRVVWRRPGRTSRRSGRALRARDAVALAAGPRARPGCEAPCEAASSARARCALRYEFCRAHAAAGRSGFPSSRELYLSVHGLGLSGRGARCGLRVGRRPRAGCPHLSVTDRPRRAVRGCCRSCARYSATLRTVVEAALRVQPNAARARRPSWWASTSPMTCETSSSGSGRSSIASSRNFLSQLHVAMRSDTSPRWRYVLEAELPAESHQADIGHQPVPLPLRRMAAASAPRSFDSTRCLRPAVGMRRASAFGPR